MLEIKTVHLQESKKYKPAFFIYAVGAMCMATGYADFPLIAYHFKQTHLMDDSFIPVLYAIAMLSDAFTALLAGRLFDRIGLWTLLIASFISMFFSPLVFLMDKNAAIIGMILWGIGMGAQESILKAAVADLVPASGRATAYGIFDTLFGIGWFGGSIMIGYLYDTSVISLVIFCMNMQFITILILFFFMLRIKYERVN
jgi:MFS family permease